MKNELVKTVSRTALDLISAVRGLEDVMEVTPRCEHKQYKLVIPQGMFAGEAIKALNLHRTPALSYVGDCRLKGGDYGMVRLTISEPFEVDTNQWDLIGCNTLVWVQ